jgi:acyl carrier protein
MSSLTQEIKTMIVEVLNLDDITADQIGDDEPLFGDGLGLDSIDALELGLAIQKKYGVKVNAESPETRGHFASAANLALFISANRE